MWKFKINLKIGVIVLLLSLHSYGKWTEIKGEEGTGKILGIKSIGNKIIVSTEEGLYLSEDNGDSWKIITTPFSFYFSVPDFVKIKDRWYALASNGVYYSTDNGNNWTDTDIGSTYYIYTFSDSMLVIKKDYSFKIFSTENEIELKDSIFQSIRSIIIIDDKKILAGRDNGIIVFSKEDSLWNYSFENLAITGEYTFNKIDSTIFLNTYDDVVISYDKGKTWHYYDTIRSDDKRDFKIFVIGEIVILSSNKEKLFSYDKGKTWKRNEIFENNLSKEKEIIYTVAKDSTIYYVITKDLILISKDKGKKWNRYYESYAGLEFSSILFKDSLILVGTSGGLIVSYDEGNTWTNKREGLPQGKLITDVNPYGNTLMHITDKKLYFLNTTTFTWDTLKYPLPFTTPDVITGYKGIIYASANYHIFYSKDKGKSWEMIPISLPDKSDISGYNYVRKILPFGEHDICVLISDFGQISKSLRGRYPLVKILYISKDGGRWDDEWETLFYCNCYLGASEVGTIEKEDKKLYYVYLSRNNRFFISPLGGPQYEINNPCKGLREFTTYGNYLLGLTDSCGLMGYNYTLLDSTWITLNSQCNFSKIATTPKVIFGINSDNNIKSDNNIYVSSDTGKTWKKIGREGIPEYHKPIEIYVTEENVFIITNSLGCNRMFVKPLQEIYEELEIASANFKQNTKINEKPDVKILNIKGKKSLAIKFTIDSKEKISAEIFTLNGERKFKVSNVTTKEGTYLFDISENIPSGYYIVRIKRNKEIYFKRINIVR